MSDDIRGVYRHYKGRNYEVLGVAKHSETLDDLIIYKPLYKQNFAEYFVRPKEMFFEDVKIDEKNVKRFTKID